MRRIGLLGLVFVALSCTPAPVLESAIALTVEQGTATSTCIRVNLRGRFGTREAGTATFREGVVRIGIPQGDEGAEVTLFVTGGSGASCSATVPPEVASGTFQFSPGEVTRETLRLSRPSQDGGVLPDAGPGPDAGVSGDGGVDGGAPPDAGPGPDGGVPDAGLDADGDGAPAGADCDDADPRRTPGKPELCAGGVDESCDGLVDCADPTCTNQLCGRLDGGARCQTGQCIETNCQNGVDDNLDGGTDCADSSCANQLCGMMPTGTCMGLVCIQPTETVCDDGMDNDGDTLADCLDADCGGRACSDGLSCTTMNVCVGMSCSAGMPVSCTTPPGACFSMMGACQEGANGCVYSPDTNASCSDGLRCTANDACRADGGCEGTPLTCTQSANTCRASTGRCVEADGGCAFDVLADGTSCSDGNTCTVGDTCQGGSCQSGVTTACQPGVCEVVVSANCLADGGCDVRRLDAGTACPGGTCSTSGTCDRFPFVPSNFDPSLVPADAGPALVITCPATFTIISGVISVMSSCSVPTPSQQVIPQDGGMDAILISTPAFRIADAGSLFISGSSHPVIFAVLGDVDIGGALDVSPSSTGTSGPGGNNVVECGAGRGADGGTNASNPRGGGGGGGFGTPGARGGNGENATLLGGAAGTTSGNDSLVPLRGGCAGGNGGGLQGPGLGGRAGGAVQITTTGELRVRGRITASGWGGLGGNADLETAEGPGGGGGGSGGGILLEARRVSVTGRLTANGGGGGSGEAGNGVGTTGTAGFPASINPAPGGVAPGGGGGSGGRGAGRNDPANQGVNGGSQGGGGGGGGGGVGRIRINAIEPCTGSPATVSPQPTSAQNGCQY